MPNRLPEREVHVWVACLAAGAAAGEARLLDAEERERASRFLVPADRERYVAAHGLLRRLLSAYLREPPEALRFRQCSQGKPELLRARGQPSVCFNLSHTGRWVAVAIAASMPVGVDVEDIESTLDAEAMAQIALSGAERVAWADIAPTRRRRCFYAAWVCKEAVLKAVGRGVGDGGLAELEVMEAVRASVGDGEPRSLDFATALGQQWRVRGLELAGGSIGAVAAPDVGWTLRCFTLPARERAADSLSWQCVQDGLASAPVRGR